MFGVTDFKIPDNGATNEDDDEDDRDGEESME
jgi:hypothetical protein